MKKFKNRIFGVIIICSIFLIGFNVFAADENKCPTGELADIEDRYDLQLEKVAEGQYKISMNGIRSDLDGATFEVAGLTKGTFPTGFKVSSIAKITKDQATYFYATPAKMSDGTEVLTVDVKLVPGTTNLTKCNYEGKLTIRGSGDSKFSNIYAGVNTEDNKNSIHNKGSICYNFWNGIWNEAQFIGIKKADFDAYNYKAAVNLIAEGKKVQEVYNESLAYCTSAKVSSASNYTQENLANMIGSLITYVKSQTKVVGNGSQTFAQLFKEIKDKATAAGSGHYFKDGEALPDANNPILLKCNWKLTSTGAADYYQNKEYYYKEDKGDPIKVTYKYNYAPGDVQTETKTVCTRNCSEAVKVEYGPPIASKAGLCFEYKVKVTSYVKCTADVTLEPPKAQTSYCSPVAYCYDKVYSGTSDHMAGPTEEFDACVQNCDGGKYTSKCSTKCFKEVYSNSTLKLALNYETKLEKLNTNNNSVYTVDKCIKASKDKGCYYRSGNAILWKSAYQGGEWSTNALALGRWYREVGWYTGDIGPNGTFVSSSNGIKTQIQSWSSTGYCQDKCKWRTDKCKKGTYLNPEPIITDYSANLAAYQTAVNKCKAAAACSSKTAEYTISIDYNTKNNKGVVKKETVEYPYSVKKDQISSLGEETAGTNTVKSLKDTTVLDYDGCYKDRDEKNWYLTEWSFPGTYIHNKTGEVSFEVPKTEGWYYESNKFCMPLDALSVNTKWWEWKVNGSHCFTEAQIEAELKNNYNIHASTKNFGYFGWNFDIACFYALRNEVCNINKDGCCASDDDIPPPPSGVQNYTVRAVDLDNLFPNVSTSDVVDSSTREMGFNWTEAVITNKNPAYPINPATLIDEIQKNATTLYSNEENLDYSFHLTPETLSKIKKYNKKYDYADWNGSTDIKNGITIYKSNLFRDTGVAGIERNIISRDAVKKTGCLGENNQGGSCLGE